MKPDNEGFLYPEINADKCVDCGLCRKVCPVEHPNYEKAEEPAVYASYLTDINQRVKSTSGGVFYAIAKYVIEKGGLVVGAAFEDNFQLKHVAVSTLEELEALRGSKYVQSDMRDIFKEVKAALKNNRLVYFTGTPCQIAGLSAYLIKPYDNLITSDLVCHGVPSQKLLDMHIKYSEEKYKGKITRIQFRDCEKGQGGEIIEFENRKTVKNPSYDFSPYLYSFMYGYTHRYSCYSCKFALIPRQGDITLGDYWGIKRIFPNMDCNHGVTVAIVNTELGKRLIKEVSPLLELRKSDIDDAKRNNGNIVQSSEMPAIRENIYDVIEKEGYSRVSSNLFRQDNYLIKRVKYFIADALKDSFLFGLLKGVNRFFKK